MIVYSYDPSTQEQRQENCWEFEDSLDYIESSRLTIVYRDPTSKVPPQKSPVNKIVFLVCVNCSRYQQFPFSDAVDSFIQFIICRCWVHWRSCKRWSWQRSSLGGFFLEMWKKKKTQTFRYSPLSSWFIFFIVFHCLIKERQHMLKEIRYMSGSEMMSIILHLAVLLSGKNTFDSELFWRTCALYCNICFYILISPFFYRYLHTFFSKWDLLFATRKLLPRMLMGFSY